MKKYAAYTISLVILAIAMNKCSSVAERQSGSPAARKLGTAVVENNLKEVQRLLKNGIHPDAASYENGYPPIVHAITHLQADIAKELLAAGADPTFIGHEQYSNRLFNYSLWYYLTMRSKVRSELKGYKRKEAQDKIAKALVDSLAKKGDLDVHIPHEERAGNLHGPPLIIVLRLKKPKWANWLIDAGADVNEPDAIGNRSLDMAMTAGDINLVKKIRNRGGKEAPPPSEDERPKGCEKRDQKILAKVTDERLQEILDSSYDKVLVYGATWCGWTKRQLLNLKSRGIPYTFINAHINKKHDSEQQALAVKYTRATSLGYPVLVYKGRVYVGYRATIGE